MRPALLAIVALALAAFPAGASIIRVDVNGGGDCLTIREGIAASSAGDTILVAPGTYAGPFNRDITVQGNGTYLVSEDGPATTIVDGERQSRVFTVKVDATVEGFTVTNGAYISSGSAFRCEAGSAVKNCIITRNVGTAMHCFGPDSTDWILIDQCLFSRNGAGIFSFGPLWVVDCTFLENVDYGIRSGGDWHFGSACNVSRSTFRANGGAGIESWEEGGTILSSVFTENEGGAISIESGWVDVSRCTIVHNYSSTSAAVVSTGHHHAGPGRVMNSIIAFNSCEGALDGWARGITHNIAYGNAGGDSLSGDHYDNYFGDPVLCDVIGGDLSPCEDSPALTWGAGAYDEPGCGSCGTTVGEASWGAIKALFR
jgi:hypothetical protein